MPKLIVPEKCPPWIENHTYDEWKRLGFVVLRGQKAKYINEDGDWVFTEHQIEAAEVIKDVLDGICIELKRNTLDSLFDNSVPGDR